MIGVRAQSSDAIKLPIQRGLDRESIRPLVSNIEDSERLEDGERYTAPTAPNAD